MESISFYDLINSASLNTEVVLISIFLAKALGSIFFIPTAAVTVFAGTALGLKTGAVVSILGNTFGALISFFLARYFLYKKVREVLIPKYPLLLGYEEKISKNGFLTVFLLRLFPLFPFSIENYILGVTKISTSNYVMGTVTGLIPGTIFFAYFGDSLRMFNFFDLVLSLTLLILFIVFGILAKKHHKTRIKN